ncbi:MAG: thymidine phosphorylase [Propionibacteriaceae bacterium]|jgi:thymidine phosphorylase|nr:thymidine phosphorylase [Propionibacteriaceae bacterium]
MSEPFDAVDVIQTKRDKGTLSDAQIDWVIDAYTRGVVAEEQMAALAMAIFLNDLNPDELNRWTAAMLNSGEHLNYSDLPGPTADKHSTGGVGDKITLPLAPLVASFGVIVPQLSGRGLGHTGGTLDKLEAIPGWRAALTNDEMRHQLAEIGAVICQAGSGLAPADRKLYALRDVTATVDCIPLIASSIMSKKLAEGTDALVLDVKYGSGAFMRDYDKAKELATTLVAIGKDAGVNTTALLTNMETPLGLTVGNALEVREAVEVLAGGGPEDVVELTVALAREMLECASENVATMGVPAAGLHPGESKTNKFAMWLAEQDPAENLKNGKAMDVWRSMIAAQGGNPDAELPWAKATETVTASESGYITQIDALSVGIAARRLGAGRARKEDSVQAGAGVVLHKKPGDKVKAGEVIFELHTDTPEKFARAREALNWEIGPKPEPSTLIAERIA